MRSSYIPHERVQAFPVGPSLTQQNFAAECDINQILARFDKTGIVDHVSQYGAGEYLDLASKGEFTAAMLVVAEAQTMFADLPAKMRSQFGNDPAVFLDFVDNVESRDELEAMGLVGPRPIAEQQAINEAQKLVDAANANPALSEAAPEAPEAPSTVTS